jgi:hypothetical protein
MMSKQKVSLVTLLCLFLVSCSASVSDYASTSPKFDLFGYFAGESQAWGMVQDYSGKQTRRFHVQLNGVVEGNKLTLNEYFEYEDGETDTRIWHITRTSEGKYIGNADDIIGQAQGEEVGNAFRWRYDFELPIYGGVEVHFDDWLYRQDEKHLFNVNKVKKLGVQVATVTLFFEKL